MSEAGQPTWWEPQHLDRERWGSLIEPVLTLLEACRDRDRFPPGLLLTGPSGLGRELVATEAAALLTCADGAARWCPCSSCRRVRRGTHPDVALVLPQGAARQIRIEQMREVVDAAPGRPFEAHRRVWILAGVEAGQLGAEAANAFLKTLEEPPTHAVFLLLASNPAAVLPTIRSRCQQLVLPGSLAIAASSKALGSGELPPELASAALAGEATEDTARRARSALADALEEAEVLHLIQLAHAASEDPHAFQTLSAVALEMACSREEQAEGLVRLAADLLEAERLTRVLHLSRERQLLACLLRWFRWP